MPGSSSRYYRSSNTPQPFALFYKSIPFFINFPFGYTLSNINWFSAEGIPVTPYDDSGRPNPYPLMRVQARTISGNSLGISSGSVIASLDTVTPVSGEVDCSHCHSSAADGGSGAATDGLEFTVATKVNDPKHPIMVTVVALTPKYTLEPGATTNYPLPPAFSMDMIGKPQPSKGKYTELVNRLLLSQTIVLPQLRGRVCVPNLMFDDKVHKAPVWVELFLVYAGGQGVGTPTIEATPSQDGKPLFDPTKGMQHSQNFDELFLFVGTDPHDTLNLGGEVVTYLGDEAYSITKASSVWVPAGVPHNPQYFKRVDRPYYMIVIAPVDNDKFFDAFLKVTPAPKTFKF